MSNEKLLKGLSLKTGPLGENDRLLTLISEQEGLIRLAVPGARRPRSSLNATAPFNLLELQVFGKSDLKKVRQIKVLKSYSNIGKCLETLAAAQSLAELCMLLVACNDHIPGMLNTVLVHLGRLQETSKSSDVNQIWTLAKSVQACIHLLAIGGYGLPIQRCCKSGEPLDPPIGQWEWRCSLLPDEGFAIGTFSTSHIQLNPSELALLQRLLRPNLPITANGDLMGPKNVWLKLLTVVEYWINNHLSRNIRSLKMLRESLLLNSTRNI